MLLVSPGKVSTGALIPPPMVIGPPTFYGHYRGLWTPTDTPPTACTVQSMMSQTRIDALASQYAFLIVEALAQDGLSR